MKLDPVFLKASTSRYLSCGPVVYRLRLRPICLGHLFLLQELRSPILFDIDDDLGPLRADELDCILAAFIFSLKPDSARRALRAWWLPYFLRFWGWLAQRKMDLEANEKALVDWIIECLRMPENTLPQAPGQSAKELGAPQSYRLLAIMMGVFGLTEQEALDMPVQHAQCIYLAWAEWDGRVELAGSPLLDLIQFAKAEDSKLYDSQGNRLPGYEQEMARRRGLSGDSRN